MTDRQEERDEIDQAPESFSKDSFEVFRDHSFLFSSLEYIGLFPNPVVFQMVSSLWFVIKGVSKPSLTVHCFSRNWVVA